MSRPLSERRQHPRFEVTGLNGHLVVPVQIDVINLSLGGIALETSSCLQFGRAHTLKLRGKKGELSLTGTVAWCALRRTAKDRNGEFKPIYRAGLEFEPLSDVSSKELWDVIRGHALVEIEDSVLGRFALELPSSGRLGASYDFAVRKLSLSGMLIETDFEPKVDSSFQLELQLGKMPWRTRARVASIPEPGCRATSELAQIGLEFHKMKSHERTLLKSFLDARLGNAPVS